jgi:hypothetical protein
MELVRCGASIFLVFLRIFTVIHVDNILILTYARHTSAMCSQARLYVLKALHPVVWWQQLETGPV